MQPPLQDPPHELLQEPPQDDEHPEVHEPEHESLQESLQVPEQESKHVSVHDSVQDDAHDAEQLERHPLCNDLKILFSSGSSFLLHDKMEEPTVMILKKERV